jgi:hypothetical protein
MFILQRAFVLSLLILKYEDLLISKKYNYYIFKIYKHKIDNEFKIKGNTQDIQCIFYIKSIKNTEIRLDNRENMTRCLN